MAIDEITIAAAGADWKQVATTSVPVLIGWSHGIARWQPVEWASHLHQAQQVMANQRVDWDRDNSGSGTILVPLLLLSMLGYFVCSR